MMNKSKIDWCDFSWNPVTGCGHGCAYCYARNLARRFSGDMRISIKDPQVKNVEGPAGPVYVLEKPYKTQRGKTLAFPAGFEPTLHEYRLPDPARKKKPASIFVCSMADLFAEAVPDEWIVRVFDACRADPWHRYMFLTKNPARYRRLDHAGALPHDSNFWYGTTITNLADASNRLPLLPRSVNRFASAEPTNRHGRGLSGRGAARGGLADRRRGDRQPARQGDARAGLDNRSDGMGPHERGPGPGEAEPGAVGGVDEPPRHQDTPVQHAADGVPRGPGAHAAQRRAPL